MAIWGIRARRLKKKSEIPDKEFFEYLAGANLSGELVRVYKKGATRLFLYNETNNKWYEIVNVPYKQE